MFYFYVLFSEKDQKYYYGSTSDLKRRYEQHTNGVVFATKYRKPLRLIYYEAYTSLAAARNRETKVKSSGSARKAILKRINHPGS